MPTVDQLAKELGRLAVLLLLELKVDHEAAYSGLWWLADHTYKAVWRDSPSVALTTMIRQAIFMLDGTFGAISRQEAALRLFNIDGGEEHPDVKQRSLDDLLGGKKNSGKRYGYLVKEVRGKSNLASGAAERQANAVRRLIAANLLKLYAPQIANGAQQDVPPLLPKTTSPSASTSDNESTVQTAQATTDQLNLATVAVPATLKPSPPPKQRHKPRNVELQRSLDNLAASTRDQLWDQHREDKVNDRTLLMPVCWSVTEQYPTDQPSNVWGEGDGAGPSPAAGTIDRIADLFESVPSRRLVVLGKGGAGKTVLVRELALRLLELEADSTVPVIFRLSSWDFEKVRLRDWMVDQLIYDYPALKLKIQGGRGPRTTVAELLRESHILPILDGLDELALQHRAAALRAINDALNPDDSLVLTSRPAEYVDAVGAGRGLAHAAVVELNDLTVEDLVKYLPKTARRLDLQTNETKWHPVLAHIRTVSDDAATTALVDVLATPLMASLAREIYSETSANPNELLESGRFPDAAAIFDHLLDAFVAVKYGHSSRAGDNRRHKVWVEHDANQWLGFLAVYLHHLWTHHFAWWNLDRATPRAAFILAAGLAGIVGIGLVAISLSTGLFTVGEEFVGLACLAIGGGLSYSFMAEPPPREIATPIRMSRQVIRSRVTILVLLVPLVSAAAIFADSTLDLRRVLLAGPWLMLALVCAFIVDARIIHPVDPRLATSPASLFRTDGKVATVRGMGLGILYTLVISIVQFMGDDDVDWRTVLTTGATFIPAVIVTFLLASSFGVWVVSCIWLAATGKLPGPWRSMAFINDACERGVLRRSGGLYEFRHSLLRDRLAYTALSRTGSSYRNRARWQSARHSLAMAQSRRNQLDLAERELRALLASRRHSIRRIGRDTLGTWHNLCVVLYKKNQPLQALEELQLLRQAERASPFLSADSTLSLRTRYLFGDVLRSLGRAEEAKAELEDVLVILKKTRASDAPIIVDVSNMLMSIEGLSSNGSNG